VWHGLLAPKSPWGATPGSNMGLGHRSQCEPVQGLNAGPVLGYTVADTMPLGERAHLLIRVGVSLSLLCVGGGYVTCYPKHHCAQLYQPHYDPLYPPLPPILPIGSVSSVNNGGQKKTPNLC